MPIRKRNSLEPVGGRETPEKVFLNRRKWLIRAGLAAGAAVSGVAAYSIWSGMQGDDVEVITRGQIALDPKSAYAKSFPARRDARYSYGRPETDRPEAARYTNFYEFSRYKSNWRLVDDFQPLPWTITVTGLCRNPITLDIDDFHRQYAADVTERQYRHRCVERWAMAVPWTGVPLARVLRNADPLDNATHVRFVSFLRPDEASNQRGRSVFPWPYVEGLTLPEAMNDLALLATGVYGRPLLKQHGAPIRLVVPWKYGYKSIKSVEVIELVEHEPDTFWSTVNPFAYPFQSNVDPSVPRPWPQQEEHMLGSGDRYPTQWLNGYEEFVGHLYREAKSPA